MKQRHRRRTGSVLAALAVLAPLLAACGAGSAGTGGGTTLRTIQGLVPDQFDPCGPPNGSESAYLAAIYAPLIRTDPATGALSPGIATDWKFSNGMRTLTLTLKTGLTFQDGTALDAGTAKQSLEQCLALKAQTIPGLKSITAQGADTLVFDTADPSSGLPALLGSRIGMLASPAARDKLGDKFGAEPVGAGPYRLTGFVPGSSVTLSKWDQYRDAGLPAARFDTIENQIITDPSAQVAALTSGQADFGWRLDYSVPAALDGTDVHSTKSLGVSVTDLNVDRSQGPFRDVRVRQAVSYAIDRKALTASTTNGLSDVGSVQPFPPGNPYHFADLDGAYPYDPGKARQLLAEAGYPNGLTLKGVSLDSPAFVNNGLVIADQLARVGIKVEFAAKNTAEASKDFYTNHSYDVISTGMNSGPDWLSIYRRLLTTKSSGNAGNVPVPGGEEAVAQASAASDPAQLTAALEQAARVLQDQLPIIPLYYSPTVSAWTGNVTGGEKSMSLIGEPDLTALGLS